MPKLRSLATLLFCFVLTAPAFAETDEQLAMRFYPQSLDEFFVQTHDPETPVVRRTTVLRVDLDGSGVEDYLAVAYSNGLAAEFVLIRGAGSEAAVVAQAGESLGGRGIPVIEPVDIENDGVPELAVEFMRETWLYKFEEGSLVLFGPKRTEETGEVTNLGNATFFDLDNDGILEIFEEAPHSTDAAYVVHKLEGNDFALTSTEVMFYDRFEQVEGQTVREREFIAPAGDYRLHILTVGAASPDRGIEMPAAEPRVTLNGALVCGSDNPEEVTIAPIEGTGGGIPITLTGQNTLSVELPTVADTYIYIVITRTN